MHTVRTFLTGRQRTLLSIHGSVMAAHKRSYTASCFQRGIKHMWCPAEDFAALTHAAATHNGSGPYFATVQQRHRFLTLEEDPVAEFAADLDIAGRQFSKGLQYWKWTEIDPYYGWNIAFRYGQLAHGCRILKLGELTKRYGRLEKMGKMLNDGRTYAGQAHFPMLQGSLGRSCSQCRHFDPKVNLRGNPTQGRCEQYARMMDVPVKKAPLFPTTAKPCKYFEEKVNAKAS